MSTPLTEAKSGNAGWNPVTRDFVERTLGLWSSHPAIAHRKAKWLFRLPLLGVCALLVWLVCRGARLELRSIWEAAQDYSITVVCLLALTIFLISFAASFVLILRGSLACSDDAPTFLRAEVQNRSATTRAVLLMLSCGLATGLLFFSLPSLLPAGLVDPGKAQRYAFIAMLLPYGVTLLAFDMVTPHRHRNKGWLYVFVFLVMVAIALFMVSSRASWAHGCAEAFGLSNLPEVRGMSDHQLQGVFRFLGLVGLFLCLYVLGEWTLSGFPNAPWEEQVQLESDQAARLEPPASEAESETEPETEPEVPEWFEKLCKSLPSSCPDNVLLSPKPLSEVQSLNPAPLAADASLRHLFGGLHPTDDQHRSVLHFARRHADHVGGDEQASIFGMDLLLEGANGVGKTTALLACALQALLTRGERVVVFAPDSSARKQLKLLLDQSLRACEAHHFFAVAEVSEIGLAEWLDSPAEFPDILLSSPESWEQAFFGRLCDESTPQLGQEGHRQRLTNWLLSCTTILVDDVASADWTQAQILHLPFLLDKHRLLLATAGRELQLLATTTPLPHDALREALVRRLFSHDVTAKPNRNLVILRPWQSKVPPRVQIECREVEPVIFHLVRQCLRLKKRVFVYLREDDEHTRAAVRDDFKNRMKQWWSEHPDQEASSDDGGGQLTSGFHIVCHLMEPIPNLAEEDERVIIYPGQLEPDPLLPQLTSRYANSTTVLFALRAQPFLQLTTPVRKVDRQSLGYPLLPTREAAPLVAAHLRSAAVHLRPWVPLPRGALSRIGVPPAGLIPQSRRDVSLAGEFDPALCFNLDPAEKGAVPQDHRTGGVWPMVSFAPEGSQEASFSGVDPEPVSLTSPLATLNACFADEEGVKLRFVRMKDDDADVRVASWVDRRGDPVGQVDLAMLSKLRIRRADQTYWCSAVEKSREGRWTLVGELHRSLGTEAVTPYWSVGLQPTGTLTASGPRSGGPPDASWVTLSLTSDRQSESIRSNRATAFKCQVSIGGTILDEDRRDPFGEAIKFAYPAVLSALLLGVDLPEKNRSQAVVHLLDRSWHTADKMDGTVQFWPELTLAMQTGLLSFTPRFSQFCRLAAFRLSPEQGGGAVLLFIEPHATAGTIEPMVEALLDYYKKGLPGDNVVRPALDALASRQWRGPRLAHEEPLDPKEAERLIQLLSGQKP